MKKLSDKQKIGIGFGICAVVAVIVGVVAWILTQKKDKKSQGEEQAQAPTNTSQQTPPQQTPSYLAVIKSNEASTPNTGLQPQLRKNVKEKVDSKGIQYFELTEDTSNTAGEVFVNVGNLGTRYKIQFKLRVDMSDAMKAQNRALGDAIGMDLHITPNAELTQHNRGLTVDFNSYVNQRVRVFNDGASVTEVPASFANAQWQDVVFVRDNSKLSLILGNAQILNEREVPNLISGGSWIKFYGWSGSGARAIQEIRDIKISKM